MKVYEHIPSDLPRTALTIGTFDGVHVGHQALVKRLRELAPHCTVVTFSNHPLSVLNPGKEPSILTPLFEKLSLLETLGVDVVIALPFTQELASQTYEAFLAPFRLSHLLLGEGDAFGKNREGTSPNILRLAHERGFIVEYLKKTVLDDEPVSSRRIRSAIAQNDFETATRLLGRPLKKELYV